MPNSFQRALWAIAVTAFAATAHGANVNPNVTVLSDNILYDVNTDGTYVMDETITYRVNTDQGVKERSQVPLTYSTSLQDLDVVEAYTTTKEGTRLPVDADKVIVQQSPQSRNAPMFDDGKVKTIVFPGVGIGSSLTLHYRRTQKKALFPGHFSALEVASRQDEHKQIQIAVRAPATLKLYTDAVDMQGGQVAAHKPDTQLWRWSAENVPAHVREIGSVSELDYSPRLVVTTFPSYQAVAAAYADRANAKATVTPSIQALADSITQGLSDKRAQAEALYRWVGTNIRYVAIFLNFGGVVPHDAQAIVDAKYGDCKDHVTLLEALLAAKGIKSSAVLVNAGTSYWIPKASAAPGVFNHAITYIPELKLYVDSTPGLAAFGTLPATEQGKQALVTDDGTGKAMLATLPLYLPDTDGVDVATKLALTSEGTVMGTSEIASRGAFDLIARQVFAAIPAGMEEQVGTRVLVLTGQSGSGTYHHGDPHVIGKPFGYSTEFKLPNYAQLPGPGAFAIPQGLGSFSSIASVFDAFGPERRELPMPFAGRRITETVSFVMPDGMTLANVPQEVKLASRFGDYEAAYSVDGRTITVKRKLDLTMAGPLLQPEDYGAARAMALDVMRSLRTQIVYR